MKAENEKRLRAAEATATWKCEEVNMRCKWHYASVALAKAENCGVFAFGLNHKASADAALAEAQSLKE